MAGLRSTWKRWLRPGARGEQGQGLAFVLVTGAVLLIFLVALVDVLWNEMKFLVKAQRRSVMVVAGDGAVDRGIYALQKSGNWDAIPTGAVPGYDYDGTAGHNTTYSDQPGVIYGLRIQEGNWTPGVQIGDAKLERTITIFLTHTVTGEKKKIQAVVFLSQINSAIFSGGQIVIGGSAEAHWGPVVSYQTSGVGIPIKGSAPPDFPVFLAKSDITLAGVVAESTAYWCTDPQAGKCVYSNDVGLGPEPIVPIDFYKDRAQNGGYYSGPTAASIAAGNFKSPCGWNSTIPASTSTGVYFFDTCDGKSYNPVTDSVCTGACSGTSHGAKLSGGPDALTGNWCGQGVLIVLGDLETKGTGCGMALTMTPPPDCYPKYDTGTAGCQNIANPTLFWDGFVYVAGSLSSSGNKKLYGTVYAYDSAGVTGNFAVYYKSNNAAVGALGKTVFTKLWMERKADRGEVFP